MNKVNYQKKLDEIISYIMSDAERKAPPRLLLHSCCAPCSSYCIEYLSDYFTVTVFYYNPNLYPDEEYQRRSSEQKRLISEMNTKYHVTYIDEGFDSAEFYKSVKGFEREPEGGLRCKKCFELRLSRTAKRAVEEGADYFGTTLTISPLKNAQILNEIGEELSKQYGVMWLPSDFKKKNGYKRSIELSREYGLYRQDYCGCVFSRQERLKQQNK